MASLTVTASVTFEVGQIYGFKGNLYRVSEVDEYGVRLDVLNPTNEYNKSFRMTRENLQYCMHGVFIPIGMDQEKL